MNKISPHKIKLNKNNPRFIKDEKFQQLVKSIKDFPEMLEKRPIVVDEDNTVLGGNMRLRAVREVGLKEVPYIKAEGWTEEQKRQFIIKDNVGYGSWNWDELFNEWDAEELTDWGLELPGDVFGEEEGTDKFSLPEGDREPFQQKTFTFADEQAQIIENAISEMKKTEEYKYAETYGNENSNGNALYLIAVEWERLRK